MVDLTPETSSQNIFEMCDEELAARLAEAAPVAARLAEAASAAGPAADDADTQPDTYDDADTERDSRSSQAPEELAAELAAAEPAAGPAVVNACNIGHGSAIGETTFCSISHTGIAGRDQISAPEPEEGRGQDHPNGSCMPVPLRAAADHHG